MSTAAATDAGSGLSSPLSSVPSSPLSSPGSTPTPPPEMLPMSSQFNPYLPSPPSSQQTSQRGSPTSDGMDSGASTDKDGPPPKKRRRTSKERTTEYLDLRHTEVDPDQQEDLDRLLNVLHKRQKIVVIAGAGMSVSAGIPDFRSSNGLFRSLKDQYKLKGSGKHLFDASVYKDDTSTSSFHDMVSSMSRFTKDARPTAFHHMLATIAKEDRLLRLYSQNVDGIETSLEPLNTTVPLRKQDDGKWPRTVQLHGGLDKMVCSKCHTLSDFEADLFSGPTPPPCSRCEEINDIRTNHEGKRSHGIGRLRPRMVLYNEHNPDDTAIGAVTKEDLRKRPDAVIVAGTTLKVPGVRRIVREMCGVVRDRRGGVAVWINNDLPPVSKDLEECFDIIVQGPCDEVASRAAMRKWDEPLEDESYSEISDEEAKKAEAVTAEVCVPTTESRCALKHANVEALPSSKHLNNSFVPPTPGATQRKSTQSPEFSPIASNRILPSIEAEGDNISVNRNGLLTPSKSQKNSPAKAGPITLKLKGSNKSKNPPGQPKRAPVAAKSKKSGVKVNNSSASKSKSAASSKSKSGPKPNTLTNTFKQSKAATSDVQREKEKQPSTPSKLRQVSNASSAEPMHALPPEHPRNNLSPSKKVPFFPGLSQSENAEQHKKRPLSVHELAA